MKLFKGILVALALALVAVPQIDAKKQKQADDVQYEISGAGTGAQGTYLVKVTLVSDNKNPSNDDLVRAAIHGVLFRGFSNVEGRQQQRPLAGSPAAEQEHADYFAEFFAPGGAFRNYGSVTGSRNVVKQSKKYNVSANVTVQKDQLSRDLGKAGVMRTLNSGF